MAEINPISKPDSSQDIPCCKYCGKALPVRHGGGRRAFYCSDKCRQDVDSARAKADRASKKVVGDCDHCGHPIPIAEGKRQRKKYCSDICRQKASILNRKLHDYECEHCGNHYQSAERHQKYCSRTCLHKHLTNSDPDTGRRKAREAEKARRDNLIDPIVKKNIYISSKGAIKYDQMTAAMIIEKRASILEYRERCTNKPAPSCKVYFKECEICGELFTSRYESAKYCSDSCRYERAKSVRRVKYEQKPKTEQECSQCGELFMGYDKNAYCSDKCRREAKQGRKAKRRAEKAGVYYEPVDPLKVFKRDGWRCQLCGKKLNLRNRGTIKANAPELDHIIPWAQGGEHSYRNTQCSCRKCNEEKGSDERGQLRLFG